MSRHDRAWAKHVSLPHPAISPHNSTYVPLLLLFLLLLHALHCSDSFALFFFFFACQISQMEQTERALVRVQQQEVLQQEGHTSRRCVVWCILGLVQTGCAALLSQSWRCASPERVRRADSTAGVFAQAQSGLRLAAQPAAAAQLLRQRLFGLLIIFSSAAQRDILITCPSLNAAQEMRRAYSFIGRSERCRVQRSLCCRARPRRWTIMSMAWAS